MRTHVTFAAIIVMLLAGSCSGSKSFSKKAAKLDDGGMYAEAADMYLQSAVRNAKNVDAKIGLKKTGQMLLNDKLSNFFKAFNMGDDKEAAVNAFLAAQDYRDRVQRAGVTLEIPDSYQTDFRQVKNEYLLQLYTEGQALLEQGDYNRAESAFAKIGKLEPEYKDAVSLQSVAYLEPLYLSGKTALASGQYRKAYNEFAQVLDRDAAYKDARALQEQAVEKGRYPIAVLPFDQPGSRLRAPQAAAMQAYLISALTELNDPFISVVDRENIDRILEEQRLGMSGMVDEASAVDAGKILGAQAVIMGTVTGYREEPGSLRKSTKEGYESYQVKELNPETGQYATITRFKPVKYTEFYKENKVDLSFSFKLVSLETGQVLMSKVLDRNASDHAWYASYNGNAQLLYPARNGAVDTRNVQRKELTSLLGAPREAKSTGDLGTDLLRSTSSTVATSIRQQLATRLP